MTKKEVAERMAKVLADMFGAPVEPDDIEFESYISDFMIWERVDRPLPDDYPQGAKTDEV